MGRLDGDTPIGPGTGPEALARGHAMGRMDGDTMTPGNETALNRLLDDCQGMRSYIARLEAKNKELEAKLQAVQDCSAENERLRGRVVQLENERGQFHHQCNRRFKAKIAELEAENDRLKADSVAEFHSQARCDLADENDALRMVVRCLAELI